MATLLRGGVQGWPRVTVEFVPGTRHAYSNAGYCVLQLVLEEVSGLSLQELAHTRLFEPLSMTHSTFDEPLPPEQLASVAFGHTRRTSGAGGRRQPVTVEGGASIAPGSTGGLWSTPSDLAKLAVEVMRSWRGESEQLLTTELAHQVMTRQAESAGLGLFLEGEGEGMRARHGGSMPGFTTHMVFYPAVGKGAVVMSNSDAGRWLNQELLAAVAREYQWPGFPVRRSLGTVTLGQMQELVGVYVLDASPDERFTVRVENGELVGQIGKNPHFELTPTTDRDLFVLASESLEVVFQRAADGSVSGVTLRRAGDTGNAYSRRTIG